MNEEARLERAEARFRARVRVGDGCWIWTGRITDGYGYVWWEGKHARAHRVAWLLEHGEPPDDRFVLHRCDEPSCVRPSHLYLGTHEENMRDMRERDRPCFGERHPSAKLTDAQVIEIRTRHARGDVSCAMLAEDFPVSATMIKRIVRGDAWRRVEAA